MKYLLLTAFMMLSGASSAAVITSVDQYTSADGTHAHSSGGGVAGVGYWYSEESRGIVEFDVSTIAGASSAIFSLDFAQFTGLYYGQDQDYLGNFNLIAYTGNGDASDSDYSQAGTLLGSYTAAGLNYGDTIAVDITSLLSGFSDNYLGFVLDPTGANTTQYATESVFTNFRIDTSNAVPEPASFALLGLGLAGLGLSRRNRKV